MLTMWPEPRATIAGSASFMPRITPWRFTSTCRRVHASSSSRNGPTCITPALLTSTSSGPSRSADRVQERGERLAAGDVERAAELAAGRLGQPASRSPTADARAARGKRAGRREADPAPASGHRDDASCELGHRRRTVPSRTQWTGKPKDCWRASRTRPRARRAARCSTSCTPTASRSRTCGTRSQSSGSRCCRSSGCSARSPATPRARSPSRPALGLDYFQDAPARARPRRARAGRARYGERDLEGRGWASSTAQAGFPDDEALEVQRVLGRGMARYAEAVATLVGQTLLAARDRRARAGRPARGRVALAAAARRAMARVRLQPAPARGAAPGGRHRRAARDRPAGRRPRQRGRVRRSRRLHRARRDDPGRRSSAASPGRLSRLAEEVVEPPAKIVKEIGDAVMLVSPEPAPARRVDAAARRGLRRRPTALPAIRAGIAFGPAVNRWGDWYGSTVNVASRLTARARPASVLTTEAVRDAAERRLRVVLRGREEAQGPLRAA